MFNQKRLRVVVTMFFVFALGLVHAQVSGVKSGAISAQDVYNGYLNYVGLTTGSNAPVSMTKIEKVRTVINTNGTEMANNYNMLTFRDFDGRLVVVMQMPQLETRTVYDGTGGYTEMSNGYKTALDGELLASFNNGSNYMFAEQHLPENASVVQATFAGVAAYKVSYVVDVNNTKQELADYYAVDNFKKLGTTTHGEFNGITVETEMLYEQYALFNGINQPSVIRTQSSSNGNGVLSKTQMTSEVSYQFNEDFDLYSKGDLKKVVQRMGAIPEGGITAVTGKTGGVAPDDIAQKLADVEDLDSSDLFKSLNKREQLYQRVLKAAGGLQDGGTNAGSIVYNTGSGRLESRNSLSSVVNEESSQTLKYRRSSLYTLMLDDYTREHYDVIKDAFGNTELSEKFNDHNLGPYLIPAGGLAGEDDQTPLISAYLSEAGVAKALVAKWFNRDEDGKFNMELIAERGQYDASEIDVKVAQSTLRGRALLADAGRELIANTFVVVYDYKYTNKEEQAEKRRGFLNAITTVASFVPGGEDVANISAVASIGSDVVGKGYFVKTTSYLYKLVWNDEIANQFYDTYWMDDTDYDADRKRAFEMSDLFKLEYVGNAVSRNNLQSTIFTSKSNEELIEIATIKAVDKNIGKLQRSYETFRVKTPLYSTEPLAATIGLKEGIEGNDKFEVLEQLLNEDGSTSYERVGVIKVDGRNIWDNTYLSAESDSPNNLNYTLFKGNVKKLAPGMLIRQIN
jgi:hypothetical protein